MADYPPGARLPPRVLGCYEFLWMLRGRARLLTAGRDIVLTTNRLLLVPPGVQHSFAWDPRVPSRHGYVHFSREHLPDQVEIRELREPLRALCAYLLTGDQATDRTLDLMLDVFLRPPQPELPPALLGAVGYLRRQWAGMPLRRIEVTELAAAAHVTRGYLTRLFQRAFGISAVNALEHLRCARAETLLCRTGLAIDTIARQTGFANISHFSHRFTQVYGMSPSAYRAGPVGSVLEHPGIRRLNQHVFQAL